MLQPNEIILERWSGGVMEYWDQKLKKTPTYEPIIPTFQYSIIPMVSGAN